MNKRDNSGALFRNEKRDKETHPTHKGQATIDGVEYWISAWVRESDNAGRYFSLAFKPKEADAKKAIAEMDEDIPF